MCKNAILVLKVQFICVVLLLNEVSTQSVAKSGKGGWTAKLWCQVFPLSWHQIGNSVMGASELHNIQGNTHQSLFTLNEKWWDFKFQSNLYLPGRVWSALGAAESGSCYPRSSFFGFGDQLRSKLPAATLKASWVSVAKLLLLLLSSLTLKQGNDTNITQNAITPTSFFLRPNGVLKWMKGNVVWNQWGKHGPG